MPGHITGACTHRGHPHGCRRGHCPAHCVEPQLHLSATPPPQTRWGILLRRQAVDTHQILEFCCCQTTWKTESQLFILYVRNSKPRKMKGHVQGCTLQLTDLQASPLSWSHSSPYFWTSLRVFMVFLCERALQQNVHLKCPDSATLQLLLDGYGIWKKIKWIWIVSLLFQRQSGCSQINEIMYI